MFTGRARFPVSSPASTYCIGRITASNLIHPPRPRMIASPAASHGPSEYLPALKPASRSVHSPISYMEVEIESDSDSSFDERSVASGSTLTTAHTHRQTKSLSAGTLPIPIIRVTADSSDLSDVDENDSYVKDKGSLRIGDCFPSRDAVDSACRAARDVKGHALGFYKSRRDHKGFFQLVYRCSLNAGKGQASGRQCEDMVRWTR